MKQRFILTNKQLSFLSKVCEYQRGEGIHSAHDTNSLYTRRVNEAWDLIGKQVGFDGRTVDEVDGMEANHILAEPAVPDQEALEMMMDESEESHKLAEMVEGE